MRHKRPGSHKPEGLVTRGKTAPNRLRRVDTFLVNYDPNLIRRTDGPYAQAMFVDLGYGRQPITTVESGQRLRRLAPELRVLGVEIDPERVDAAQAHADEKTFFRLGGFNLPLQTNLNGETESVRLLRAFNVLRQYDEAAVADAYARLAQYVLPGGLFVEGTSSPYGRIWVANVARKMESGAWHAEALVFSTNFRSDFSPGEFQTVLPKNLIHRVVPGETIHGFFQDWKQAAAETSSMKVWGHRQWFIASAQQLAKRGYTLKLQTKWLRGGWLIWQTPPVALFNVTIQG